MMQAHVGDMVWCDGKIVTVPTKYTPDDSTVVYYLTLACHDERGMQKPSKKQPNGSASKNG